MECPIGDGELTFREIDGVTIHECPVCKGLFFEKGELEEATEAIEPDLDWVSFDLWKDPEQYQLAAASRHCPRDGAQMATVKYGEPAVDIDVCPQCHGSWLDKGEFDKLIQSLESQLDAMSASDYVKESVTEARELVSGEDTFSSEWKDLGTVLRLFQYRMLVEHPTLAKTLYFFQRTGLGLAGMNPPD